ncbi:MAG: sulfite exporter TauE/SafE family protein [Asgard group archaeon]|nr:sulfite exporter TauE/SafE family protein [Asgard group archaeon]
MPFEFMPILLILSAIAFVTQFIDSALGMGFGSMATPILLILGYEPREIVPAILITELIAGIVVTVFHKLFENLQLGIQKEEGKKSSATDKQDKEVETSSKDEWEEQLADKIDDLTIDSKVIIILSAFAVIGTIIASSLSVVFEKSSEFTLGVKIYIGLMIAIIGLVLIILRNKDFKLSWPRIISLGALAGFNKGLSGGGYGPLTVSGQILSGRDEKHAIASTLLAETIAVFAGAITYVLTHIFVNLSHQEPLIWDYLRLTPYLLIGAVAAAPLAAYATNKLKDDWINIAVGSVSILLGVFTLIRVVLFELGLWENIPEFVEML